MPLFQQSVLKKYLSDLDKTKVSAAWNAFMSHFHDTATQANISQAKEEQYQEGFLRDLFVNVLGYTPNPQPGFNLTTEYKNEKDGKKADGAIIKAGAVRAVIELKGTDTTDLSKIEQQAFGYLHNQKGCTYVITSNFEKLRFYIQDATEHIEFNLFTLSKTDFDHLYLCLHADNLMADMPLQVKQQSLTQEDAITKKLYADYSTFKQALYQNIVSLNPQYDKILLFKKTQKLLDRFLFILFAEDRLLLPPNFIIRIVEEHRQVQKLRMQQSLYERFKIYFTDLLHGNKEEDIFAYNGGLFEPDDLLDNLTIADDVLQVGVLKLSNYDYNTEVDVNILGHIFEHSLNEIEELQASLSQASIDRTKTRRKKEGVFYTPRYITKYIVENTLGALCKEQKAALQIVEEDYAPAVKKTKASEAQRKVLVQKLDDYRAWLLQLTICDPACGSGAFLNAALEFLITEHNYVDELTNKLMGAAIGFTWTPNDILEHNLFGVDINEEAVEIARLSLWLRTAQKGRKLSKLSGNIKAGNSLIDDPAVAGEKAFVWQEEFKEVFDKGGFDVVIGNPPYLRVQGVKEHYQNEAVFYEKAFDSAIGNYDLYVLFIEKSHSLINRNGCVSFILPHKFLNSDFGKGIRSFLLKTKSLNSLVHFGSELIFSDAATYTCIIRLTKAVNYEVQLRKVSSAELNINAAFSRINYETLQENESWILSEEGVNRVLKKLEMNKKTAKDYIDKIFSGIQTSGDNIYLIKGRMVNTQVIGYSKISDNEVTIEAGIVKPIVKGDDISKYLPLENKLFVIFPYFIKDGKASPMSEDFIRFNYPSAYKYLKANEQFLRGRENGKMNKDGWFLYIYPKSLVIANERKLVSPDIIYGMQTTIDEDGICLKDGAYGIKIKEDYQELDKIILAILNSQLLWFYLQSTGAVLRGSYFRFKTKYIEPFPFPELTYNKALSGLTDLMLSKSKELHALKLSLLNFVNAKHEGLTITKRLSDWPQLPFKDFLKELEKQKVKLPLTEQAEWLSYFEGEKKKAVQLQDLIDQTDKEIDQMVYALYGLTEEEIAIIENS